MVIDPTDVTLASNVVVLIGIVISGWRSFRNGKAIQQVHLLVNSQLADFKTALIAESKLTIAKAVTDAVMAERAAGAAIADATAARAASIAAEAAARAQRDTER